MRAFLPERDRNRATVAKEPAFGFTDAMEFASPPRPKFPVALRFDPNVMGQRVRVGVSPTAPPLAETVLHAVEWTLELEAGVFAVFFVDGITRQFEVVGGGMSEPIDLR
jgi:hypothetical protein